MSSNGMPLPMVQDEDEMLGKAIAMSLDPPRIKEEENSEEEMMAKAIAMSME